MNPHRLALLASLLLSVGLSAGCSSTTHQLVPMPAQDVTVTSPDVTRIYFVRDDSHSLYQGDVRVTDGDTDIGDLSRSTYLCWERAPGRTLGRAFYEAVDPSKGHVEGIADLDCAAGRAYYFKVSIARAGGKPEVVPVDEKEGRSLVAERRPAEKP